LEIASGYFGCRTREGRFDPERFAAQAREPQVKMIEIKLSQGADSAGRQRQDHLGVRYRPHDGTWR
jgi:glutamate synthase domain-containing protein 2